MPDNNTPKQLTFGDLAVGDHFTYMVPSEYFEGSARIYAIKTPTWEISEVEFNCVILDETDSICSMWLGNEISVYKPDFS